MFRENINKYISNISSLLSKLIYDEFPWLPIGPVLSINTLISKMKQTILVEIVDKMNDSFINKLKEILQEHVLTKIDNINPMIEIN